jgi:hypothetical protein
MSSAEKQNLRIAILKVLDANQSKYGLNIDAITLRLTPFGFDMITAAEVETVMPLLEGEKLIARLSQPLTPGVAVWRITNDGRSYLVEKF